MVSISLNGDWHQAFSNEMMNIEAAERAHQFFLGWFAHPIYVDGDYPSVMKDQVAIKSAKENLTESRLPQFTEEQKQDIKGDACLFMTNSS